MTYQIKDLIDSRNGELYRQISSKLPIELIAAKDDNWRAETKDGKGIIEWASTRYPIACFTHELLHLSFDQRGMGCPGFKVTASVENEKAVHDSVGERLPFICNQLIHHKIFQEFIAMGFPSEEFLGESSLDDANNCAKRDLPKLRVLKKKYPGGLPCKVFVFPYLFLRSPEDNTAESKQLLKELRNLCDQNFYELGKIITALQQDPKPYIPDYLRKIFVLCDQPEVSFAYV
ncbi:MAG TPA: hypothetical protein VKC60_13270 [Opitutaceae bacterium]|nr:hypothetical protein [Opitutaceae bacterium]